MKSYMWINLVALLLVGLLLVSCQTAVPGTQAPSKTQPVVAEQTTTEATNVPTNEVSATDITILGKEGFSQEETRVTAGTSITWTNQDPKNKNVVLNIETRLLANMPNAIAPYKIVTSPQIRPGQTFTHTFSEPGDFFIWVVGYGVKQRVVVS